MANSMSSNPIPNSSTTIHDLPEPLLTHILSFLYIPEAIQTSLVSRSFRNLWHSLPSLHFDIFEYYSRSTSPNCRGFDSRQHFAEFVSHTLLFRQPNALTKLKLTFEYYHYHKSYVQSWIRYAVNSSVSQLFIDFRDMPFYEWDYDSADEDVDEDMRIYTFHLSDVCNSSIESLKIFQCPLIVTSQTNCASFVSLTSLELAFAALGDHDVRNMLAGCVNLETLILVAMKFTTPEVRIHSNSLKELELRSCCNNTTNSVDICCPSLHKIKLVHLSFGKYIIKDTTLVEEWVDFMSCVQSGIYYDRWEQKLSYFSNMASLDVWEELLESSEVPAGCERFASNVKHLEINCDYNDDDLVGVAALLKLLPKLEILGLCYNGQKDAKLLKDHRWASTVFYMPCLRTVMLRNYQKTRNERHFIKLFRKNGIVLENIQLLGHFFSKYSRSTR